MIQFDFITHEEFRNSLESDFREMAACVEAHAWKAVHVLAGSIIEAVLIDYLLAEKHVNREDALKMDFGQALSLCKDKGIISAKTVDLSTVIKDYRNLIHPGRTIRLNEKTDHNSAEVARALVSIVLAEVEKRKRENYGYTAEQIVAKLQRDSSADSIVPHLIKNANPVEVERLLLKVLPESYMQALDDFETPDYVSPALRLCFRAAFEQAPDDLKKRVIGRFVRILKEESDRVVLNYEDAFFRSADLKYVASEEADLVKQHLLGRLQKEVDEHLLITLQGIGKHIKSEEVSKFVDPLIRAMRQTSSARLCRQAQRCIEDEWGLMPQGVDKLVIQRIDGWIALYREKGLDTEVGKLEQLKSNLEAEIPF